MNARSGRQCACNEAMASPIHMARHAIQLSPNAQKSGNKHHLFSALRQIIMQSSNVYVYSLRTRKSRIQSETSLWIDARVKPTDGSCRALLFPIECSIWIFVRISATMRLDYLFFHFYRAPVTCVRANGRKYVECVSVVISLITFDRTWALQLNQNVKKSILSVCAQLIDYQYRKNKSNAIEGNSSIASLRVPFLSQRFPACTLKQFIEIGARKNTS